MKTKKRKYLVCGMYRVRREYPRMMTDIDITPTIHSLPHKKEAIIWI
jgi:hypothetical protein